MQQTKGCKKQTKGFLEADESMMDVWFGNRTKSRNDSSLSSNIGRLCTGKIGKSHILLNFFKT
jgi:hypothetical protein